MLGFYSIGAEAMDTEPAAIILTALAYVGVTTAMTEPSSITIARTALPTNITSGTVISPLDQITT